MTNSATGQAKESKTKELQKSTSDDFHTDLTDDSPQILFGDDNSRVRDEIADILQEDLGCKVLKPTAFKELTNDFFSQSPDGLIMDYSLRDNWKLNSLSKTKIQTGYDYIRFCQKINPMIPMCIYSRQIEDIPENHSIFVIDKSHSDYIHIRKEFKRFITLVKKARKFFGKIQPKKRKETPESEMNKYRIFLEIFNTWLNCGFERLQNPHWITLLDRKIEMCGTTSFMNKEKPANFEGVLMNGTYPTKKELDSLSAVSIYKPIFYWNSNNEKVITRQFESAGQNLEKIPFHLQEYFSICMTSGCAKLYLEDEKEKAIQRVKSLTVTSQLEFVKSVFKKLFRVSERDKFKRQCEEARLPVILSLFNGRIDEIITGESGVKTAWVLLEKVHSSKKKIAEPFDYSLLSKNGIEHQNSLFEYTVYKREFNSISVYVTPDYSIWSDFKIYD